MNSVVHDARTGKAVAKAIDALVTSEARSATVYLTEKLSVRVSRRMYIAAHRKKGPSPRRFSARSLDLVVTVGRPNHSGREFVKRAKAVGEPFPIKRVQLSFPKTR